MFYNNLYNRTITGNGNGNCNCNGNVTGIGNGTFNGNYTFVLQSKVEHTIPITTNPYNITISSNEVSSYSSITYIAQVPTIIFLPIMNEYIEKVNINIINNSDGLVTINTQNGELMYNSSYLPPNGSNTLNLTQNKFCKLILNKKQNNISYILLLT
jgi:hypothetical protein